MFKPQKAGGTGRGPAGGNRSRIGIDFDFERITAWRLAPADAGRYLQLNFDVDCDGSFATQQGKKQGKAEGSDDVLVTHGRLVWASELAEDTGRCRARGLCSLSPQPRCNAVLRRIAEKEISWFFSRIVPMGRLIGGMKRRRGVPVASRRNELGTTPGDRWERP